MVAAFVSFPFDVTEERRNDARATFEKVAVEEARLRKQVSRLESEMHELRSMQSLKAKNDPEEPLEVHRLRAALRREQAVRDELEKEVDALKGSRTRNATVGDNTASAASQEAPASREMIPDSSRATRSHDGQHKESSSVLSEELRKETARARAMEVIAGEKDRECGRLREETLLLRDELYAAQQEMAELESAAESMASRAEKECTQMRERLRLSEGDVEVAEEEKRDAQRRYRLLVEQLHRRGIAQYDAGQGHLGMERLVTSVHEGVDEDMLWEEMHLLGHERDLLASALLDLLADLSRACDTLSVPLAPDEEAPSHLSGRGAGISQARGTDTDVGRLAGDGSAGSLDDDEATPEKGREARMRRSWPASEPGGIGGGLQGMPLSDKGALVADSQGVEWSVAQSKRLVGRLINGLQLFEQRKEAELLHVRLDLHKATGTPLPSVHSTPRSPSTLHAEGGGGGARAGERYQLAAAEAEAEAVRGGRLELSSRVAPLSVALRASQDEVARLRSHILDADALRRAGGEAEADMAGGGPRSHALMERALTLTLDLPFEHWCAEAEEKVVEEVALVAGVEMHQVSILAVSPGSVVLKIAIDAPDLAACVRRLDQDVSSGDGQLLASIGATHVEPPQILQQACLPARRGRAAASETAPAWMSGLRALWTGLSTGGLASGVVGAAAGGGRVDGGANEALDEAVLRAERAEARALHAEKHLVQLGTPREVLAVLQRKCCEAEVEASRSRRQLVSLNKLLNKMEKERAGLQDALQAAQRAGQKEDASGAGGGVDTVGLGGGQQQREGDRGPGGEGNARVGEMEAALAESEQERDRLQDELRDVKAVLSQARLAAKEASGRLEVLQAEAAPTADAPSFANGGGHRRLEGAADEGDVRALEGRLRQAEMDLEKAREDSSTKGQALRELEQECEGLREHLRVELEQASQVISELEGERTEASAAQESAISHLRDDLEQMLQKSKAASDKAAQAVQALVGA